MANFEDVLEDNSISYRRAGEHHHARTGWVNFDCPYCGKDTEKFHMGYSSERRLLNCWKCGRKDLVDVLSLLLNVSIQTAIGISKEITGKIQYLKKAHTGKYRPPDRINELASVHRGYLRRRKFDPVEITRLWNVRGIGLSNARFSWRLFIPYILDDQNVNWTTRSVNHVSPNKYVSASANECSIPRTELLYGEDYVRNAILAVEGPTDVWRIGPGAVATSGLSYSSAQVEKLAKYPIRGVCFDNSIDAQNRASELCDALSVFPGTTYRICLIADDPGSADKQEIKELREMFFKE